MNKILVSACLAGCNCRYDGKSNSKDYVVELVKNGKAIVVCPEQLGGLDTPRDPSEIVGDSVLTCSEANITTNFKLGATCTLKLALENNVKVAILKSKSPSCGTGVIYDGTFSGVLVNGYGITAKLLIDNGIKVMDEIEGAKWYEQAKD